MIFLKTGSGSSFRTPDRGLPSLYLVPAVTEGYVRSITSHPLPEHRKNATTPREA